MRPSPIFLVTAVLFAAGVVGCTPPPPQSFVSSSAQAQGVSLGKSAFGEDCRLVANGTGSDVWCGAWQSPSVRVRASTGGTAAAAASESLSGLSARLDCQPPTGLTILGGEPALLAQCRLRNGGWPAFVLASAPGGRGFVADGVLTALPAAERAIGVASGKLSADQAPLSSQALDSTVSRLARQAFATGDIGQYDTLMSIGRDANQAERFVTAETAYRAALALQQKIQGANTPDSFQPLLLLALQLSNQGRTPEAEELFRRADGLTSRAADPLAPAFAVYYRGLAAANEGKTQAALDAMDRAETLYAPFLPPELRSSITSAALPADRAAALSPLLTTRDLLPDPQSQRAAVGVIEARRNAAGILRKAGRLEEAQAKSSQAARLAGMVPGMVGADLILARIERTDGTVASSTGATATADRRFGNAVRRFARGVPRSRPYAETLLLQAESLQPGDSEILRLCRDAVATLRELREGTTPALIAPCIDAFVIGTTDPGRLAEGFEAAQLGQGSVTTTQIAHAAARLSEGARDPKVGVAIQRRDAALRILLNRTRARDAAAAESGGNADLSALDASIAAAQADATEADQAVQFAAPGFAQLVQSIASAKDVQAAMQPGEAMLLTTLPPRRRGWNFLLHDGTISAVPVSESTDAIAGLVRDLRASVEDGAGGKPFAAGAAYRLDQALLGGFQTAMAGAKSLLVVPSGPLLQIPYGILVTKTPPAPLGHAGNVYLIEQLPVTHLPAAASLVSLRHSGRSNAPLPWVGFGAPRPMSAAYAARSFPAAPECGRELATLPALPGAQVELTIAAQVMGSGAARPVIGPAFTADALARTDLKRYRVLHLATHGLLPSDLACLSEPVIVGSTAPSGPDASQALISASVVLGLNLDADLVIVSACNSGGGAAAGESLSTLARAFFFAGARSLLLTHWYINDIAAARIGASLLQNVQRGVATPAALRQAQLDLLHIPQASHPALWGPFALEGTGANTSARDGNT